MNAIELYHQDGKPTGVFYCSECRIVHRGKSLAEKCCAPVMCCECGHPVGEKYYITCNQCRDKKREAVERERFEKAEKLTDTECGPVVHGDTYAASVEELLEMIDGEDRPEYFWTCNESPVCNLDARTIIGRYTEDAYEDFDPDTLKGIPEFEAACKAFNVANAGHVKWDVNYKACVLLPKIQEGE